MALRPNQAEARRTRVGGSEVAGLLGLSPFHTPQTIYDRIMGLAPETPPNEAMRLGELIEDRNIFPTVLRWRGMVARRCAYVYTHESVALSASPDYFVNAHAGNPRGLLEAKVSSGNPPKQGYYDAHYFQLQVQLGLSGRSIGYLAYLRGSRLDLYTLPYDATAFEAAVSAVRVFTEEHLLPGIRPADPEPAIVLKENK